MEKMYNVQLLPLKHQQDMRKFDLDLKQLRFGCASFYGRDEHVVTCPNQFASRSTVQSLTFYITGHLFSFGIPSLSLLETLLPSVHSNAG